MHYQLKVFFHNGQTFCQININMYVQSNKRLSVSQMTMDMSGRRGRDRMVVGFTTTSAICVYHH
jgi:hypothetical protein